MHGDIHLAVDQMTQSLTPSEQGETAIRPSPGSSTSLSILMARSMTTNRKRHCNIQRVAQTVRRVVKAIECLRLIRPHAHQAIYSLKQFGRSYIVWYSAVSEQCKHGRRSY